MAKSTVTMKDIAEHLGVSTNTVHKAVTGKPGVSDALRRHILAYAEERGYERNMGASSLRRKDIVISACLPALDDEARFFYGPLWEGCRAYVKEHADQGVRLVEDAYCKGSAEEALTRLVDRMADGEHVDGVLAVPVCTNAARAALARITSSRANLVFVSGDDASWISGRYGAVMADFEQAGALMAEQAVNLLPAGGRILLLAGDPYADSHYLVARSFHAALAEQGSAFAVEDLYGFEDLAKLTDDTAKALSGGGFALACCVFARGSVALARALEQEGMAGTMPALGSDVFDETAEGLRAGTFTNLVYKNPRQQGYLAMKMICDRALKGPEPGSRVITAPVELVFRSTLSRYLG